MTEPTREEIEAFKKEFGLEDKPQYYQDEIGRLRDASIKIDIDQQLMDKMDETEEEREEANRIGRGTRHLDMTKLTEEKHD